MPMARSYDYINITDERDTVESEYKAALQQAGVVTRSINMNRQAIHGCRHENYEKLLTKVRPGDILVINTLDWIGRTNEEIIAQWYLLTKVKTVHVVVLDIPALNEQAYQAFGLDAIWDIVLDVYHYAIQKRRIFEKQQQREGITPAKQNGVKCGRPVKEYPLGYESVRNIYLASGLPIRASTKHLHVAPRTFKKWVNADSTSLLDVYAKGAAYHDAL